MADERNSDETARGGAADEGGAAAVTGGTDKAGPGGLAGGDMPDKGGETGVRETGDISGATSTHAGAGGNFGNTGGTGTAPTE
jgi:hypothetical protein